MDEKKTTQQGEKVEREKRPRETSRSTSASSDKSSSSSSSSSDASTAAIKVSELLLFLLSEISHLFPASRSTSYFAS